MNLKQCYTPPALEPHPTFIVVTGISLPIGTSNFTNPLETDFLTNLDFMETEQ